MKKRILAVILAIVSVLSLCAPALAADEPAPAAAPTSGTCGFQGGKNVTWKLTKNSDGASTYTLTFTGTGEMEEYSLDFGDQTPWHEYQTKITRGVVGSGITWMGECAFYNCTALKSVTLPNTLQGISMNNFRGCKALKTIDLPDSVKYLHWCAFYESGLTEVTIPEGVEIIMMDCFGKCTSLKSVTIPKSVTTIEASAFEGCRSLKTVYGYPGTAAEKFAKANKYTFVALSSKKGLVTENGKQYIYKDGKMQTGLVDWNGKTYYCAKDGHVLKSGWANAGGGRYYYCAKDGHIMKGGTLPLGGKTYYVDSTGLRKTGIVTYGGKAHYFSTQDGHLMKNGWINAGNGKRYYADKNGVITKGL